MNDPEPGGADQTPEPPAAGAARGHGRLRWALAVSVALNLLLGGLIVGAAARDAGWRGGWLSDGPRARWSAPDERVSSLRGQARDALGARAPALEARRSDLRAAWRAVRDAAQADPLDRARLDAALAALRAAEAALAVERHAAFATLAASMPPERRAKMLREMGARFERRDR